MPRLVLIIAALIACAATARAAEDGLGSAIHAGRTIDQWVETFNPDLLATEGTDTDDPRYKITNTFTTPASDIARAVRANTWFTALVFLPFLILPQVLLVYIIFKFKDRGDGRRPATFMANHKLEIIWTAIPFAALIVVSVPSYPLLWWMEEAPKGHGTTAMRVEVLGKRYVWDYSYLRLGGDREPAHDYQPIRIGSGVPLMPDPLVLVKGRTVALDITSADVNHAWWIPAFGVKKDAIAGRYTHTWFTPDTVGFYKGQCAELCGADHGVMLISAVVVEEPDFDVYVAMHGHRDDALGVLSALRARDLDAAALKMAVDAYFAKDRSRLRHAALRYWAANAIAFSERHPQGAWVGQRAETARQRRQAVADLVAAIPVDADAQRIAAADIPGRAPEHAANQPRSAP